MISLGSERVSMDVMINDELEKKFNEAIKDAVKQKDKVLEDFCRAYLASSAKTEEEMIDAMQNIELVFETRGFTQIYYFRRRENEINRLPHQNKE